MSFNRNSDYRRNKNTPDIVYRYATGETYRYHKTEDNKIVLIITEANGKSSTSIVPETEMTVTQFDALKSFSDHDYHETDKRDVRESRNCVSLSGLEDSIIGFVESPEDILIRCEEEKEREPDMRTIENAMTILNDCLDEKQRKWFILFYRDNKSAREIALEYGVAHTTVARALKVIDKKIKKYLGKA